MQEAGENYSDTEHTVPQLLNRFVAEGAKAERPHHCRSFRGAARPMGLAASTCCCGSTPSASWARTSSPSAALAKSCARTEMRRLTILDFGTYLEQRPASGHR